MSLPIFANRTRVGVIETEAGGLRIRYEQDWRDSAEAFPISLTMPLSAPEWGADVATPWLMNLLPEGEPLRAMTRVLGVAGDDIIGLISETGRDLAGALTIGQPRPDERPGFVPIESAGQLEALSAEEDPAQANAHEGTADA